MKKNETVTIKIEDIGVDGEGIGKVDGYTLFVKNALIGDEVEAVITKAKKHYGYAKMLKILTPSPNRVPAKCPEARRCGGCQIQELSYQGQLQFKEKKVRGNLERIGGFAPELLDKIMEPICGMEEPFHYRNKAQFPFGIDKEGNPVTGFYAGRTHQIIPNTDCALGAHVNKEILEIILDFMKEYNISAYDETTGKGLVRHALIRCGFTTKEIMVCLVINGDSIPQADKLVEKLTAIEGMASISYSINKENTNVIMGKDICTLWGESYITDSIGNVEYQISPLSFYQVNPVQTEKLYGLALEYANLTGNETVWDLYCGIGTISLFLAQNAKKVYGVEIIPQAIEDARRNAELNQIHNAEFFVGKAEEILPAYYKEYEKEHGEKAYADVIVVDPPRKGCDETLLETMIQMQPERIVYVSCDSATLARDLRILCDGGYELRKVRPVDQFCHTVHVETVCLLEKQNK
jgi:23S rRNA (uracil1939-C5)-methyltransferase